jgi:hypothetical protein
VYTNIIVYCVTWLIMDEVDTGMVVRLEHVNLNIGSSSESFVQTHEFYRLGPSKATMDADAVRPTMWVNLSHETQLHFPRKEPVQRMHGAKSAIVVSSTNHSEPMECVCPTTDTRFIIEPSTTRSTIRAVRVGAPVHALPCIARYWSLLLKCPVTSEENQVTAVVGPGQVITWYADEETIYTGYHVCIYVSDWVACFQRHLDCGLLYTQHEHADKSDTLQSAQKYRQFRARDVQDEDGSVVYQFELEIRSLYHPDYHSRRYLHDFKK